VVSRLTAPCVPTVYAGPTKDELAAA